MSEAAMPPLELILRQCASAAPQPWYPKQYSQQTGTSREALDPHLDRLRLGGFVQLTEWTQEHGQGYVLTPAGQELLARPRILERVRQGDLPEIRPIEVEVVAQPEVEIEGDRFREMVASAVPFRPRMTIAILWINIAVFGVGLVLASRANVAMSDYLGMGTPIPILLQEGALRGDLVFSNHQWWRLITCAFVHIGIIHLLVNMISLWFVGPVMERLLGTWRYLAFYLLSAVGGSFGALIDSPGVPVAGASGALWGLMGGLAVYVFANRRSLPPQVFQSWFRQLLGVILLNAVLTMQVSGISKGAHFGGGIAGALLVLPVDGLRLRRGARALLGIVGIGAIVLAGWLMLRQSPEVERIRFNESVIPPLAQAIGGAEKQFNKLLERGGLLRLHAERRDPEEVQKELQALDAAIEKLSAQQGAVGSYHFRSDRVEQARLTALDRLAAYRDLLTECRYCLKNGVSDEEETRRINGASKRVREVNAEWERVLGGSSSDS